MDSSAVTRSLLEIRSFHCDKLGCLKAAIILLLEHVDFKVMVPFKEAEFVLKASHCLLGVVVFLCSLRVQLMFKFLVLLLEDFKDILFVLELLL